MHSVYLVELQATTHISDVFLTAVPWWHDSFMQFDRRLVISNRNAFRIWLSSVHALGKKCVILIEFISLSRKKEILQFLLKNLKLILFRPTRFDEIRLEDQQWQQTWIVGKVDSCFSCRRMMLGLNKLLEYLVLTRASNSGLFC